MLKINSVVPGDRLLIDVGCKYISWKVLYLIATEDSGIIKYGITYLSKYPYPFYNVAILPVAHPILMSTFFGSIYEVDYHNKSRNSYLAL